jgi:hypothetical protein
VGRLVFVLPEMFVAAGCPLKTEVIANVLSGEKRLTYTPTGWLPKTSSLGIHNFVSGSTIRSPFGTPWAAEVRHGDNTSEWFDSYCPEGWIYSYRPSVPVQGKVVAGIAGQNLARSTDGSGLGYMSYPLSRAGRLYVGGADLG